MSSSSQPSTRPIATYPGQKRKRPAVEDSDDDDTTLGLPAQKVPKTAHESDHTPELQAEIQDLRRQVQQLQESNRAMEENLDNTARRALSTINRNSENYPRNPALMRTRRITRLYERLADRIKELVHRFLHDPFPLSMTDYPSVVAQHEVLDDGDLYESVIWRCLYTGVFRPKSLFWAGKAGRRFMTTCEEIRDNLGDRPTDQELEKFHDWRSRGVNFLTSSPTDKSEDIDNLAAEIMTFLWMSGVNRELWDDLVADVKEVVAIAGELDLSMRRCRAEYSIEYPWREGDQNSRSYGFPYDRRSMEMRDGDPLGPVLEVVLVVSPSLVKRGTTLGERFREEKRLLVQHSVVC